MKESALKELYIKELRDTYDAEKQITKALPEMAKAGSSSQLRQAFEEHLQQTKNHVERLEQISQRFRSLLAPGMSRSMRDARVAAPEPSPMGRRNRAESRGN